MLKSIILATTILFGATRMAGAQGITPATQPQPTTWQLENQPLDKLLNDGWSIQSSAGEEGAALILSKSNQRGNNKFMRCVLTASNKSQFSARLELLSSVSSICQSLN